MLLYLCDRMERGRLVKRFYNNFNKRIIFCGRNSGVHGLKYVFGENGTVISRSVWLVILLLFMGCLYFLLVPVLQRSASVSFTPDTRHLHWNTKFPGVTVCEKYIPRNVQKKMLEQYPDLFASLNLDFRRYVADVIYGRGTCSKSLCLPCGHHISCNVPWRNIIDNIHKKCEELIVNCHFNEDEFNCCDHFYTVDSEYGPCYSFNSLQGQYKGESYSGEYHHHQFVVNRTTGPGILSLRLLSDAQISVHSPEELSTNVLNKKHRIEVKTNVDNIVDFLFSIVEVDNESVLKNEDVSVRRCRYEYEIPEGLMHTYKIYSYGGCNLAQNTEKSYKKCNCVHPVRALRYADMYCNYTGINCLVNYEIEKKKLGHQDRPDTHVCLPSCVESEINTIHISKRTVSQIQYGALINIRMVHLPTMRYQKNLLRTNLDLVVTVGGIGGLFFSASILSFAEVFYLILRTPNK